MNLNKFKQIWYMAKQVSASSKENALVLVLPSPATQLHSVQSHVVKLQQLIQ